MPDARFDACAKIGAAFTVRNCRAVELIQPFKCAGLVSQPDFVPAQAGPVPEIHLAQVVEIDGRGRAIGRQRRECLADALHWTRVDGRERLARDPAGERRSLLMTERREFHVDPAAEHPVVTGLHFRVANQEQAGG